MVDHFKYIGAYCSADDINAILELNYRLSEASDTFRELDMAWRDRYFNLGTEMTF